VRLADAAVLVVLAGGLGLRRHRVPDQPQQSDQRDLEDQHDPDEAELISHTASLPLIGCSSATFVIWSSRHYAGDQHTTRNRQGELHVLDHIKLEVLDKDGALREAAEDAGLDRGDFLRRGAGLGAGFVAGGVLLSGLASPAQAAISTRRRSKSNDVKIANYALTLEYLEAEFYAQALRNGTAFASDQIRLFATITGAHEADHVKALRGTLGRAAVRKPTFDFGDTVTDPAKFQQTAQVLEDTGVAAYAGQGPNILQRPIVQAALSIHSVEARHAAWIRFLNGGGTGPEKDLPAPRSFDRALSERAVLKAVTDTGFIEERR
jgi:hypothetical protein